MPSFYNLLILGYKRNRMKTCPANMEAGATLECFSKPKTASHWKHNDMVHCHGEERMYLRFLGYLILTAVFRIRSSTWCRIDFQTVQTVKEVNHHRFDFWFAHSCLFRPCLFNRFILLMASLSNISESLYQAFPSQTCQVSCKT